MEARKGIYMYFLLQNPFYEKSITLFQKHMQVLFYDDFL